MGSPEALLFLFSLTVIVAGVVVLLAGLRHRTRTLEAAAPGAPGHDRAGLAPPGRRPPSTTPPPAPGTSAGAAARSRWASHGARVRPGPDAPHQRRRRVADHGDWCRRRNGHPGSGVHRPRAAHRFTFARVRAPEPPGPLLRNSPDDGAGALTPSAGPVRLESAACGGLFGFFLRERRDDEWATRRFAAMCGRRAVGGRAPGRRRCRPTPGSVSRAQACCRAASLFTVTRPDRACWPRASAITATGPWRQARRAALACGWRRGWIRHGAPGLRSIDGLYTLALVEIDPRGCG